MWTSSSPTTGPALAVQRAASQVQCALMRGGACSGDAMESDDEEPRGKQKKGGKDKGAKGKAAGKKPVRPCPEPELPGFVQGRAHSKLAGFRPFRARARGLSDGCRVRIGQGQKEDGQEAEAGGQEKGQVMAPGMGARGTLPVPRCEKRAVPRCCASRDCPCTQPQMGPRHITTRVSTPDPSGRAPQPSPALAVRHPRNPARRLPRASAATAAAAASATGGARRGAARRRPMREVPRRC
jgi:hypothetical protein